MSIKLEIPEYDRSALRRFGEALIAIATDGELASAEAMASMPAPDMMAAPTLEDAAIKQAILESIPATPEAFTDSQFSAPAPIDGPPEDIHGLLTLVPAPPAPPAPAPGPQLDTAGIPWDARIHATSKTTCKDGTWKLKPGVDKALVSAVIAELKGVQAIPVPPPAPTLTVVPAPPPAPPAAPTCPPDFASFIKEITGRITLGQLTPDQVNATCQTLGLDKCNLLAGRPDLIPAVWAALP